MRKDSRLSRVLHILVHMETQKEPIASDYIATMLSTNPVVVRRMMGALRDKGYVRSTQGRSGGWMLACALDKVTLLDIHSAFGETSLFTIGLTDEHQNCPIEKSIHQALESVLDEAESMVLKRFGEITLDRLKR